MEAHTIQKQNTQMQDEWTLDSDEEEQQLKARRCAGGKEPSLGSEVEMVSVYQIPFPLPEHTNPEQCRDEFLKDLLEPYRTVVEAKQQPQKSRVLSFVGKERTEKTVEGLAIKDMIKRSTMLPRKTGAVSIIQRRTTMLYAITLECQKASVDFMLPRLRKQLSLFSNPWPGEISEMPNRLFRWSVFYFMQRLHINQLYLEVIQRERTVSDLDCIKFRTDLHEIISLVQEVRDDFVAGRDICYYSMTSIQDARYTTNAKWITRFNEARKMQDDLMFNTFTNRGSRSYRASSDSRQSAVQVDFEHEQAVGPIEMRYRINWMHSVMDQKVMRLQVKENLLQKELNEIEKNMKEDELVHNNSDIMYVYQIESFRNRIREWEEKMEADLEQAELMCNQTNNKLQKVKDDLKHYKDQEEMFKRKISEVRELIEKEEQERIAAEEERQSELSRKRSTKGNNRRSAKNKKKKF